MCEMKVMNVTDAAPFANEATFERVAYSSEIYPIEYVPNFHELEYAMPVEHGKEALRQVRALMLTKHTNCIYPVEYRFVAGRPGHAEPILPARQRDDVGLRRPRRSTIGIICSTSTRSCASSAPARIGASCISSTQTTSHISIRAPKNSARCAAASIQREGSSTTICACCSAHARSWQTPRRRTR